MGQNSEGADNISPFFYATRLIGSSLEVVGPGKQRRPAEARALLCWLVREIGKPSLTELSRELRRDVSSLSMAMSRLLRHAKTASDLAARMERLKRDVMES